MSYVFPFGQKLEIVKQDDRSPKKFFVLGVYASAVHARWRGMDNKIRHFARYKTLVFCIPLHGLGVIDDI